MKEPKVSYETAELALSKGFENDSGCEFIDSELSYDITQSVLAYWLRKNHKVYVSVGIFENNKFQGLVISDNLDKVVDDYIYFNTYEEAMEDALHDALTLIK